VGCATFQFRLLDQKAHDDPMDDLQQGRERLGMGEGNGYAGPQRLFLDVTATAVNAAATRFGSQGACAVSVLRITVLDERISHPRTGAPAGDPADLLL